jgi:hypothetical protein
MRFQPSEDFLLEKKTMISLELESIQRGSYEFVDKTGKAWYELIYNPLMAQF